jgi:hypothetical protein
MFHDWSCCLSRSQLLVFEVVRVNEFQHRIAEQKRILAVADAPHHFVEIGREMLRTDLMPRAHDAALEHRKCGLHTVCVGVSPNVLFCAVLDRFVLLCWHPNSLLCVAGPPLRFWQRGDSYSLRRDFHP